MRKFLIRILFKLLDNNDTYADINDARINSWLSEQGTHRGFLEYMRKRDLQLLKTIGSGLSEDNTKMWIGQRLELFRFYNEVKTKVEEKDKLKKKNAKKN